MLLVCAWCGQTIGEKAPVSDSTISHGICPSCALTWRTATAQEARSDLFPDCLPESGGHPIYGAAVDPAIHPLFSEAAKTAECEQTSLLEEG